MKPRIGMRRTRVHAREDRRGDALAPHRRERPRGVPRAPASQGDCAPSVSRASSRRPARRAERDGARRLGVDHGKESIRLHREAHRARPLTPRPRLREHDPGRPGDLCRAHDEADIARDSGRRPTRARGLPRSINSSSVGRGDGPSRARSDAASGPSVSRSSSRSEANRTSIPEALRALDDRRVIGSKDPARRAHNTSWISCPAIEGGADRRRAGESPPLGPSPPPRRMGGSVRDTGGSVRKESFIEAIAAWNAQYRPGVRRGIMSSTACIEAWRCSAAREERRSRRAGDCRRAYEHAHRDRVRIDLPRHDLGQRLGQRAAEAVVQIEDRAHQPIAEVRVLGRPADEAVDVGAVLGDEGLVELDLLAQPLLGRAAPRDPGRARPGTARRAD